MGNLATLAVLLLAAGAAQATDVLAPLRTCSEQRIDATRLACFDREVAALLQSGFTAPNLLPALTKPEPKPESQFGWSEAEARRHANEPAVRESAKTERLTARVQQVHELTVGRKRIILDNGQIWSQVSSSEQVELQAGDTVTIRPGMLGSFLLIDPRGRSTKVHREQ